MIQLDPLKPELDIIVVTGPNFSFRGMGGIPLGVAAAAAGRRSAFIVNSCSDISA